MKKIEHSNFEGIQRFRFGYHPFQAPKFCVHVFWVDRLLIDTGQRRMRTSILKTLKHLEVDQICVTHYHEDHTGNIQHLKKYFQCPVWGSKACEALLKNPPSISFPQWMFWGNRKPFHEIQPLNKVLETASCRFEVIEVPGHSKDMIALFEPNKGWLFTADLFVHHYIAYFLEEESLWWQIQSLKKVLALDFKWIFCSHHHHLNLEKHHLIKKLEFLESFYGQTEALVQRGYTAKEIFKSLALKENWPVRFLSNGRLSKMNMVNSVIRDLHHLASK